MTRIPRASGGSPQRRNRAFGLELEVAIEAGINRLRLHGYSADTVELYREDLDAFNEWFDERNGRATLLGDLTVAAFDEYLLARREAAARRGDEWTAGTTGHHCRNAHAFCGHITVAYGLAANPLRGLGGRSSGRPRERAGDALDAFEIEDVLRTFDPTRYYDVVTRALFAVGAEVGPRTSELIALSVEDFKTAMVRDKELGPVVHIGSPAKGGLPRTVPIGAVAERYVLAAVGDRMTGPLFPAMDGGPMTEDACYSRLVRVGKRVGTQLYPQRLRRSAASTQVMYGALSGHLDTVFGWMPQVDDFKSGSYIVPTLPQLIHAHQWRFSPLDQVEEELRTEGRSLFD